MLGEREVAPLALQRGDVERDKVQRCRHVGQRALEADLKYLLGLMGFFIFYFLQKTTKSFTGLLDTRVSRVCFYTCP